MRQKDELISKAAAINAVESAKTARTPDGEIYVAKLNAEMNIQILPSAQPKHKTGHWVDRSDNGRIVFPWWNAYSCDECGGHGTAWWKFCPHCGAKMEGDGHG